MEASLVVLNISFVSFLFCFCTAFVPLLYFCAVFVLFVYRCCTFLYRFCTAFVTFCTAFVPLLYFFVPCLYSFCTAFVLMYPFCTSPEKDCFNIATKRIATKRIATKGIATKGIAFPDLSDLCEKHMFYKIGHNSGPRGSPDMILTAFDVKFHEKKDELPPEA